MEENLNNNESFVVSRSKSPEVIIREKRGNFILRQELNSYNPECNPKCGMIFNLVLTLLFFSVGLPIIFMGKMSIEYRLPYTDCSINTKTNRLCNLTLIINETMPSPVYFYYELDNFYLNHRDIVKSKSWGQLKGQINSVSLI